MAFFAHKSRDDQSISITLSLFYTSSILKVEFINYAKEVSTKKNVIDDRKLKKEKSCFPFLPCICLSDRLLATSSFWLSLCLFGYLSAWLSVCFA